MPPTTAPPGAAVALRALRVAAGMTLDDVAQRAGISPSYLSRAENGQVAPTAGWYYLVTTAIGETLAEAS